jgi:hypothetical protein
MILHAPAPKLVPNNARCFKKQPSGRAEDRKAFDYNQFFGIGQVAG